MTAYEPAVGDRVRVVLEGVVLQHAELGPRIIVDAAHDRAHEVWYHRKGVTVEKIVRPARAADSGGVVNTTSQRLAALSRWIDEGNAHRDPEAITWGRLAKVSEECGEVIAAYIGATGQNPRKGVTHTSLDVIAELLDVAVTALGAVEHLTHHEGHSMDLLNAKVEAVYHRAGLEDHR